VTRALALVLLAAPVSAREPWTFAEGRGQVEARAYYKTWAQGFRMPEGLVLGTEALQALVDEAREVLPDDAAAELPADLALPRWAGLSAHSARGWGRLLWDDWLEVSAGWQIASVFATHPSFAGGGSLLGSAPVSSAGAGAGAKRRLWDFEPTLFEEGGLRFSHDLDLLAVKVHLPFADVVVGRQVLSWGAGRFWNPTDLLAPFGPADVDREVRRGVEAVRVSVPIGEVTLVDALWLPQKALADNGFVLRAQTNVLGFDVSLSAAKYVSDVVVGADFSGDAGPLGVHGEAAYTFGLAGLDGSEPVRVADHFLRAVAGVEWRPLDDWIVSAEYYFNGLGACLPSLYAEKMRSPRIANGEVFGAGRHYLALAGAWRASELLSIQAIAIANVLDPSVMILPVVEYWFEQGVLVRAGAILPLGAAPDASALQALTLVDLVTQTESYTRATSSFGFRSEYGAAPAGAFAQVGIYF
jgi:hypothetical protein